MTVKIFGIVFIALSQLTFSDVPLPRRDSPVDFSNWLLEALKHHEGENALHVYRNVQKLASPDKGLARLAYYPFSEWTPREQREALAWVAKNDACIGAFERATRLPHCWLSFIPLQSGKLRIVESGLTGADIQHAARCLAVRARQHARDKKALAATNDAVMLINAGRQIQELPDIMYLAGLHIMELGYLSIVQLCHDIPDGLEYEELMRRVVRQPAPRETDMFLLFALCSWYDIIQRQGIPGVERGTLAGVDWTEQGSIKERFAKDETTIAVIAALRRALDGWSTAIGEKNYASFLARAKKLESRSRDRDSIEHVLGITGFRTLDNRVRRCLAARSAAITILALHAYRGKHGSWPSDLCEIVELIGGEAPRDPFGCQLRYKEGNGTFLLYSIGQDGKDDGGRQIYWDEKPSWTTNTGPKVRGDYVFWPPPARDRQRFRTRGGVGNERENAARRSRESP